MRSAHSLYRVILVIAGIAGTLPAQTTVSSFVDEVLAANPSVSVLSARTRQAEARIGRSAAWSPPQVTFNLMDVPISEFDIFSEARDKRLSITQMMPFPGKTALRTRIATLEARMADTERRDVTLDVRQLALILYAEARGRSDQLLILRKQLDLVEDLIRSVESRYTVGRAHQADLLRLHIERDKLRNELSQLDTDLTTLYFRMNELRGKEPDVSLGELAAFEPPFPTVSSDSLTAIALLRRPDLERIKVLKESARTTVSLASRSYWPDLMVGAGYRNSMLMGRTWELMVGISIPVAPWSISGISGRTQEARAGEEVADALAVERELMTRRDVAESYQTARLHFDRLQKYRTAIVPSSEQAMRALQASYITDETDFLSLIDSYRAFEALQTEMVQERIAYLNALVRLERAVGSHLDIMGKEMNQ